MARAVIGCNFAVIPGFLGSIPDHKGDGRTGGKSLESAGKDFYKVIFLPGGGNPGLAGFAPVQIFLNIFFAKGQACGAAVDNNA